jgi:hypothetical protein
MQMYTARIAARAAGHLALHAIFVVGAGAAVAAGDETNSATKGSGLTEVIEIREAQSGFAGVSGTITRIEPDGAFTISHFLNEAVQAPHQQGRLTEEQQEGLSRLLEESDLSALPKELGERPEINEKVITVTVGEDSSTLFLDHTPSDLISQAMHPPETPEGHLIEIINSVKRLIEEQ